MNKSTLLRKKNFNEVVLFGRNHFKTAILIFYKELLGEKNSTHKSSKHNLPHNFLYEQSFV